ncbi:hypothetical protein GVN21_16700 [Caulobacter sp. SLTY]|uniref:hypothetical protein n=1 Tax=Caulobacter sp. SLTY TaxID=2683262 RepID=UPI001412AE12|nr:hypothetical protein [Caulobacter sp. SLTY]NBB17007.1 hypothetical protein [Caulobacter sp. SLTY]
MTALAVIETEAPAFAEQTFDIPISKIRVGVRLRELDPVWAAALGGIMDDEGQRTPIDVYPVPGTDEYELGPGLHRTMGRKGRGHATVRGFIRQGVDALERRSREVSENLWRLGLEPLDRAAHVAELYQLLRLKAGVEEQASLQSVAARARWEKTAKADAEDASRSVRLAYGFAEEAAERLKLDRATVYRDLQLHRGLARDVAASLKGLPVATNAAQLRTLAKLPQDEQRRVAELLTSGHAKAVGDAVATMKGAVKPSAEAKRLSAFIGAYSRMGLAEKKAALTALQGLELPKGWSLQHG